MRTEEDEVVVVLLVVGVRSCVNTSAFFKDNSVGSGL